MTSLHLVAGLPDWLRDAAIPVLVLHIAAGTIALLSGTLAISVRKGERIHRLSGTVFFVCMVLMGASASFLAALERRYSMVLGGLFAVYLVATAWIAARRADGETGRFERVAMIAILVLATLYLALGLQAHNSAGGKIDGFPAAAYFFVAGFAALIAAMDLTVVIRGGRVGAQRVARHLWRMCVALFFAAGSFFTNALPRILPHGVHGSPLLIVPVALPLLLMAFWLIRVLFTKWHAGGTGTEPARP